MKLFKRSLLGLLARADMMFLEQALYDYYTWFLQFHEQEHSLERVQEHAETHLYVVKTVMTDVQS